MNYLAFATDYDGTLATDGVVEAATIEALTRLQQSGWTLILITGRQFSDLQIVFEASHQFDCIVAENGAVLHYPKTGKEKRLGDRPSEAFIAALQARGVEPISIGQVIVATWEPHDQTVQQIIHEQNLPLQVILNKGAVMVLPTGIDKAAGLKAAIVDLKVSLNQTVGVGDAENDRAFLDLCGYSVAVANALSMLKETVDWVTPSARGAGICELIEKLLKSEIDA